MAYAVENYDFDCEYASPENLQKTINQAEALEAELASWSWFTSVYTDDEVDPADWVNNDANNTYGDDEATTGVDSGDVGYFSGHGAHHCDEGNQWWSNLVLGDDPGASQECRPDTNPAQGDDFNDLKFGDAGGDLEIVLVDACRSVNKCVWENVGYAAVDGGNLIMYAGFHGVSFDTASQVTALADYADASRYSGAGEHWLDYRYVSDPDPDDDQCPAVVIRGDSGTSRADFYENGGLDDRFSTGTHTGGTVWYVSGCDPIEGFAL